MHFRKEKGRQNIISLEDSFYTGKDGEELRVGDTIPSSEKDILEEIGDKDLVERLINIILNLFNSKKRLVMLYKIAGMKQDIIALNLNISQSYISRMEKKLQRELKLYLTTQPEFKEVFSMSIVDNSYRISFSSKKVEHFNQIFATLLQSLTSLETLPDFKVVCNKERIIVYVPANPESFSFIAQIIKEIDDFSLTFVSNKSAPSNNDVSQQYTSDGIQSESDSNMKDNEDEQVVKENIKPKYIEVAQENAQIISDKESLTNVNSTVKAEDIRKYMLSKENFTVKELKRQFPNATTATINNAVQAAKNKGIIISTGRGKYAIKKD